MKKPTIIIGGMGPQASVELHKLIVNKASLQTTGKDKFPDIMHASVSVTDFIADEREVDAAVAKIKQTCAILPIQSAAAVGLACNTAHLLIDKIEALQTNNFVSMIDAVCETIESLNHKRVGLLASPFTIKSKLYENPLRSRGIDVITPEDSDLPELTSIIRGLISGKTLPSLRSRLTCLTSKLEDAGANCILLGCTELPLIGIDTVLPTVSSLDILAAKLLQKHHEAEVL